MAEWKWVKKGSVANRILADGSHQSMSVNGAELAAFLAGGGVPDPEKSVEERRAELCAEVDFLTTAVIEHGFVWNAIRFPLDPEHKGDYQDTVNYLKAGVFQFPFRIKGEGSAYVELTEQNIDSFLMTGVAFRLAAVSDGWALKDGGTLSSGGTVEGINNMTYEQLETFTDPRL